MAAADAAMLQERRTLQQITKKPSRNTKSKPPGRSHTGVSAQASQVSPLHKLNVPSVPLMQVGGEGQRLHIALR